jgi:hypothetical protein
VSLEKILTIDQQPVGRASRRNDQLIAFGPDCGYRSSAGWIYFKVGIVPHSHCSLPIQTIFASIQTIVVYGSNILPAAYPIRESRWTDNDGAAPMFP